MMISGHRSRAAFDRDNIVSERDLHHAASKLDAYVKKLESQPNKQTPV